MAEEPKWIAPPVRQEHGSFLMIRHLASGAELRFLGESIRDTNTGMHATVHVFLGNDMLDWDEFNLGRSGERTKLVNKAHKRLGNVTGALYSKDAFDQDMDYFCLCVSRAKLETAPAEEVEGKAYQTTFLLDPYVAAHAGTIIFAAPGSTKSYLGLLAAVSIDAGVDTIWKTVQRKVLFINLERSRESMAGRLWCVNRALGLPGDRPLLMMNDRGKTLAAVAERSARTIQQRKVECVFLDSISRSGGDLNDNRDANAVMDVLNGFGGAWLAIGHTSLGDQTRLFGSQMFGAAADLTVQVNSERRGTITGVALKMMKFNDVPPRDPEVLVLEFGAAGLVKVRRQNANEFPGLETAKATSLTDEICECLPEGGDLTAAEIFERLTLVGVKCSKESVRTTLYGGAKNGFFRQRKDGKEVRWSVLNQ